MSRKSLGPIVQLGYVVDDLDSAIARWTGRLHVGPFFVSRHAQYAAFEYEGGSTAPDLSLAFAFSGEVNIELIQQHDDTPSPFLDYCRAHGEGLQHLGVFSDDLDADSRTLLADGSAMTLRLVNAGTGVETRFFDASPHPGALLSS